MSIPIFIKGCTTDGTPIIKGYLSHFLMHTVFETKTNVQKEINSLISSSDIKESRVQARCCYKRTYRNEKSHDWFGENDSTETITLCANKEVLESKDLYSFINSKDIINFIKNADAVLFQIKVETTKTEKFLNKLSFCNNLIQESKSKLFKNSKFINPELINEIHESADSTETKWSTLQILYPRIVTKLKSPCGMFSSYAAILKQGYKKKSESNIRELWTVFLKVLRESWEEKKDLESMY